MNTCAIDCHVHLLDVAFGGNAPGAPSAAAPLARLAPNVLRHFERLGYRYLVRRENPLIRAVEKLIMLSLAGRMKVSSAKDLVASMEKAGVRYCVIHPVFPFVTTDAVFDLCDFKAFFPFCSPPVGATDCAARAEADLDRGCLGIKIHPLVQGIDLDGGAYFELAALAAARRVPLLTHFGGSPAMFGIENGLGHLDAKKIAPLAKAASGAPLIIGHAGLWQNEEVLGAIKGLENVYIDTSFQAAGFIRKAARTLGARRLLLGSDFPIGNQKLCRDNVLAAGLSDGETEEILSKNAISIMDFNKSRNNYHSWLANKIR